MNRLPIEKRAQIIGPLVEGMSMRAVARLTGVSITSVTKLLEDVGLAAGLYQANEFVADLASRLASRVQLTTDGHRPYLEAVEGAFGGGVNSPCW